MPEALLAFIRHGYVAAPAEIEATSPDGQATLSHVLELPRARGGHDFGSYKHSTLRRRVHRRLGLRNIETFLGNAETIGRTKTCSRRFRRNGGYTAGLG